MHVRTEWDKLIAPDFNKVSTLCGRHVAGDNATIPGLYPEHPADADYWCRRCMMALERQVESIYTKNEFVPNNTAKAYLQIDSFLRQYFKNVMAEGPSRKAY